MYTKKYYKLYAQKTRKREALFHIFSGKLFVLFVLNYIDYNA